MKVTCTRGRTEIPNLRKIVIKFFGKKSSQSVNPDEVVAIVLAFENKWVY